MGRQDLKKERAYRADLGEQPSLLLRSFNFDPIGKTPATERDGHHVFAAYPEAKPSSWRPTRKRLRPDPGPPGTGTHGAR